MMQDFFYEACHDYARCADGQWGARLVTVSSSQPNVIIFGPTLPHNLGQLTAMHDDLWRQNIGESTPSLRKAVEELDKAIGGVEAYSQATPEDIANHRYGRVAEASRPSAVPA
jgi:hypothetical protein